MEGDGLMHISKNCKRALKALDKMGCTIKNLKGGWRITPPRATYTNNKGRTANEAYTMHPSDRHLGVLMDHIVRSWDFDIYAPHLRELAKAYPPIQQKAKA
tara:strand:- start:215 stop:517 length:303 start_codon:yes stop_codon:yes gene_type:complete